MTVWNKLTGSGIFSDPGADPTILYGPVPAAGLTGQGILMPPMRVGTVIQGDVGTEWLLCRLVLAGLTDLVPGQVYQYDEAFTAVILPVTNTATLNQEVGVAAIYQSQAPAGTYYIWLARSGHLAVQEAAASVANGYGEANTPAGTLKFLAAPTASTKGVAAVTSYYASAGFTFTANTVNGSPTLTNLSSVNDLMQGQLLAGTGIPANANIMNIRRASGGSYVIDMGTSTAGNLNVPQNASANGTGITVTVTGLLPCNIYWPTIRQN